MSDRAQLFISSVGMAGMFVLLGAAAVGLAVILRKRKAENPVAPERTSFLAFLCFSSGMLALLTAFAAAVCVWLAGNPTSLQLYLGKNNENETDLLLAARIVAVCSIVPALATLGFWLAARGAIRDAGGRLLGGSLYRTGLLMALLAALFAFPSGSSFIARGAVSLDRGEQHDWQALPEREAWRETECGLILERLEGEIRDYLALYREVVGAETPAE